jgi:ribosomal protein L11 methylase PrmA
LLSRPAYRDLLAIARRHARNGIEAEDLLHDALADVRRYFYLNPFTLAVRGLLLAAPLIEMAPALVRRVGHHGQLVLSGIASSVEEDVNRAYTRLGLRRVSATSRTGWVALVLPASW